MGNSVGIWDMEANWYDVGGGFERFPCMDFSVGWWFCLFLGLMMLDLVRVNVEVGFS